MEPLPRMPDPKLGFGSPAQSPDGKYFAGSTGQLLGGTPGIWLYSLETRRYEKLSDRGFYPQWMPDGKRVFFVDGAGASVVDIASRQIRPIPIARRLRSCEIAPDGRSLILYERSEEADIWLMK